MNLLAIKGGLMAKRLVKRRCKDADDLWNFLSRHLKLRVPRHAVCEGHQAPFDYLVHAYFEPASDLVVWAPRGGGKTRLGAAATLLDLLHKPPVSVRILGGSLDQSRRMWEHLTPDLEKLAGKSLKVSRQSRIECADGSQVAVLTQSQRAVRGLRVQKLRCDEVELFRDDVWEAAQLVTRSLKHDAGADWPDIRGVVEVFSTLHAPFGLMHRIVEQAERRGTRIIKWCVLDVLAKCPPERECDACPLMPDCKGVAKTECDGFFDIDDAIAMKQRVGIETWEAEMLCKRPNRRRCVFNSFDPQLHVRETSAATADIRKELSLAIDFGYANPFVCLWIATTAGVTHVIDEYVQPMRTVEEHLDHLAGRPWGRPRAVACDPAGSRRDEQTAVSNLAILRRAGYAVRCRPSRIVDGIELVRAALRPASGEPRLFIHPRCKRLIEAMRQYHYPDAGGELPVKDGIHDHLTDALRYHFVNRAAAAPMRSAMY